MHPNYLILITSHRLHLLTLQHWESRVSTYEFGVGGHKCSVHNINQVGMKWHAHLFWLWELHLLAIAKRSSHFDKIFWPVTFCINNAHLVLSHVLSHPGFPQIHWSHWAPINGHFSHIHPHLTRGGLIVGSQPHLDCKLPDGLVISTC